MLQNCRKTMCMLIFHTCIYVIMYVLLHSDLYVVAIDWPGHGLSSPRPAGAYYHLINYVTDLRHVIDGKYNPS